MRDQMDDAARESVTSACEDVRTAGEDDLVDLVVPGLVARPTSTQQVSEVLRAAAAHGLTVVPRGRGTKMTWGLPPTLGRRARGPRRRWTRCSTTRPVT